MRDEVIARWQQRREVFDESGVELGVRLCDLVLSDLATLERAAADEVLTLDEAARASGYSADHLRHLVSAGDVPNAGRKHAPRVRRADLPERRKGKQRSRYDVEADARAIAGKIGTRRV